VRVGEYGCAGKLACCIGGALQLMVTMVKTFMKRVTSPESILLIVMKSTPNSWLGETRLVKK
jgi:hypothetical protein